LHWYDRVSASQAAYLVIVALLPACHGKDDGTQITGDLFTELTSQANLDFVHEPGVDGSYFMPESFGSGCAFLDYDNDGALDIYLINAGGHNSGVEAKPLVKNRLFRQKPQGGFEDVTDHSGLGDTGYGMGVAVGDLDNDGFVDIYISNEGADVLYHNNRDGTFTDITDVAGIDNPVWSCSATFLDYDCDGFLDIYVTNYLRNDTAIVCTDRAGRRDYCGPAGFPGIADKLYHNQGNGVFIDVSGPAGIASIASKGLGVVSFDSNGDAYPDLYVGNDDQPNQLWINQKNGTFANHAVNAGSALNRMAEAEASMGIAAGDVDGDNDFDLFCTHLRGQTNTFYQYDGVVGFLDETVESGLAAASLNLTGFGTGFFDADNDGDLDLAVVCGRVTRGPLLTDREPPSYWDHYAEPNLLFENDGTGHFENISHRAQAFCASIENSRGLAFGDIDNDGDIDLLITNEGGRARLYRNDHPGDTNWLGIRTFDPQLNRDVYGSRVTILTGGQKLLRYVSPGYSYLSSSDARLHVGLGNIQAIDALLVQWPGGFTEKFSVAHLNRYIRLDKGTGITVQ
jgi:hypothetical protein